jgi:hypothetical protein
MTTDSGLSFRQERGRGDCSGRLMMGADRSGMLRFEPTSCDVKHNEWNPVTGSFMVQSASLWRRFRLIGYAKCVARDIGKMIRPEYGTKDIKPQAI